MSTHIAEEPSEHASPCSYGNSSNSSIRPVSRPENRIDQISKDPIADIRNRLAFHNQTDVAALCLHGIVWSQMHRVGDPEAALTVSLIARSAATWARPSHFEIRGNSILKM